MFGKIGLKLTNYIRFKLVRFKNVFVRFLMSVRSNYI